MNSLPRNLIISSPLTFRKIIRRGRHLRGERISIFWMPGESSELKVGFTTTRKVKNAVARNRARRLMREVFRRHRAGLKSGIVLVLRWSGRVAGWSYRDAERELLRLWERAAVLRK